MKNYKTIITTLIIISLIFTSCKSKEKLSKNSQKINYYTVLLNKEDLRNVKIEADLILENDTLYMDWESASFLDKGWSHFVRDIKAFDKKNKQLKLTSIDNAKWLVKGGKKNSAIHLEYSVQIDHDKINWEEGGHDESAYVLDKSLFFIGSAVFITASKKATTNYEIEFNIPKNWNIASSLKAVTNHKFTAKGIELLRRSCFFIGDILKQDLSIGENAQVQLAAAKNNEPTLQFLSQIVPLINQELTSYFGGEGANRFLCIANIAPNTKEFQPYFSGGAFPNAMSIILPGIPDQNLQPVIGYLFTHELTHLWNGVGIKAETPRLENWFIEGFTDYITLKTLLRLGFIDQEFFLNNRQGIRDQFEKYTKQADKISMRNAGLKKQEYYDLVYSGGFIMAFITDIELVNTTKGEKTLKNFMQTMYKKYGNQNNSKNYKYEDILKVLNEQSSMNFTDIYKKYVLEKKIIPISDYLNKIGLEMSIEGNILKAKEIDSEKELLMKKVL